MYYIRVMSKDFVSINEYLDNINEELYNHSGRVIGEVSEVTLYPGRSYLFFKIKDKDEKNPAILSCMMWKSDYELSGLKLENGLEIIVSGKPGIYKPLGRFTFNTKTIELVGEGALKLQYEKLKQQLEKEGLFLDSKKRLLPILPSKIGLITSKDGAVINDFQVNLGKFGFKVLFIDSRVEGQLATQDLLDSIRTLKKKDIEILVLIRGGGSLESLLAFNNETLVREIANFPVPVLVGIGHEKDIPLVSLVADKMVSTPTAVAHVLNETWQSALHKLDLNREKIFSLYKDYIFSENKNINDSFNIIKSNFQSIFDNFDKIEESIRRSLISIENKILEIKKDVVEYPKIINNRMKSFIKIINEKNNLGNTIILFKNSINKIREKILSSEKLIVKSNPQKLLKLGYSIVKEKGILIRKIKQIKTGQMINVMVEDGSFESEVKIIN